MLLTMALDIVSKQSEIENGKNGKPFFCTRKNLLIKANPCVYREQNYSVL